MERYRIFSYNSIFNEGQLAKYLLPNWHFFVPLLWFPPIYETSQTFFYINHFYFPTEITKILYLLAEVGGWEGVNKIIIWKALLWQTILLFLWVYSQLGIDSRNYN